MGMLRVFLFLFGIVFLLLGMMGLMSFNVIDDKLLGFFEVTHVHNLLHVITGVLALLALTNGVLAKLYFQIFGIVFGIMAILGFSFSGDLYMMNINLADTVLYLFASIIALFFGFISHSVD